jgi:HlyD family secretion protein
MPPSPDDPRPAIRRLNIAGIAIILVLFGAIGGWAATSELAGAVIAPGTIVVESNVKKVQHPTGGTVGKLNVEEGSSVEAGDVLLRLDDTVPRATLGIVRSELDTQLLREARLTAERDGDDAVKLPDALTSRSDEESVKRAFAGEQKLFEARRNTLVGQRAQFREQVSQLDQQIAGLVAQETAKEGEITLLDSELVGVSKLYEKQLINIERRTELERNKVRLDGERGQLIAEVAAARGRISEIELKILQLDKDFQTDLLNELRDCQAKIAELEERQTAAEDQLRHIDIRAPQSGFVHELAVHTVGGVVGPGETIMLIVPRADALVVDAKVTPENVDQVAVGAPVKVRVMVGNQRTMPTLDGRVVRVAPDLTVERAGERPYYLIRVALDPDAARDLDGFRLIPGMPAEVFVATGERTPLQYLLKPLREQVARTFRER